MNPMPTLAADQSFIEYCEAQDTDDDLRTTRRLRRFRRWLRDMVRDRWCWLAFLLSCLVIPAAVGGLVGE